MGWDGMEDILRRNARATSTSPSGEISERITSCVSKGPLASVQPFTGDTQQPIWAVETGFVTKLSGNRSD